MKQQQEFDMPILDKNKLEYDANKILEDAGLASMGMKNPLGDVVSQNFANSLAQQYAMDINSIHHPSNMPGTMFGPHAMYTNTLAPEPSVAGYGIPGYLQGSDYDFNRYTKGLKGIESSGGKYHLRNNKTGALGAYQILPKTLASFQKRTGERFSEDEFLANPKLQDKYFNMVIEDNAKTLKNYGMPINNMTLWAAHNLGPKQAKNLFNNLAGKEKLDPKTIGFIKSNTPRDNKGQLIFEPTAKNYISYYSTKFGY